MCSAIRRATDRGCNGVSAHTNVVRRPNWRCSDTDKTSHAQQRIRKIFVASRVYWLKYTYNNIILSRYNIPSNIS
jgi:hypothetical protein